MKNECPNCGYQFSPKDATCPYCGTANPSYQGSYHENTSSLPHQPYTSTNNKKGKKDAKFNVLIFILLLFFFWPIAIVYLVLTLSK